MLFASVRALADNDTGFLRRAATNQFDHNRLADCFRGKLSVHVLHSRDRMRAERDQQIADHDAGFVRGAVRLHFDDDGGGFLIALQRLAKRFRQPDWMQPHAEIAMGNVSRLQQGIDDAVHRGSGDGNRAEAREARRGNADRAAVRIDDGAAHGCRLQSDVKPDVGRKRRANPGAPLGRNQADGAESGNRSAGARPSQPRAQGCRV